MAFSPLFITSLILLSYISSNIIYGEVNNNNLSTYIIHVQRTDDSTNSEDDDLESWYRSFLPTSTSDSQTHDRLLYSYKEVFPGFAARLTENELKEMSKKPGYVQALPDRYIPLQTTHTPSYLGLKQKSGIWKRSNLGKGVIVGVFDTGILPEHPSFADDGIPPPPKKWKGYCNFTVGCNNKIIGARTYLGTKGGPVDNIGHGSHTASTIGGNFVTNVNPFGLGGYDTMSGMAPHAHLAIYQICNAQGCLTSDTIAAFDDAVRDGVDVLSLSLASDFPPPLAFDPVAISSFKANEKGITVICAGGNMGPTLNSVANEAPWILTVAASSVDRSFRVTIKLDNGEEVYGEFCDQPFNFSTKPFPVYPDKDQCRPFSKDVVKGKIVLCPLLHSPHIASENAKKGGAVGIIFYETFVTGYTVDLTYFTGIGLPGAVVSFEDGMRINASRTTSLYFHHTVVLGVSPAPAIASFSSRGPATFSPGILKPDITAPGLNIIAAWHQKEDEHSKVPINAMSGTSAATPHASGIAALIKSAHPHWSPSAIRSAMVTTSDILGNDGKRIKDEKHKAATFFVSGAGHINASKAARPGLVYETDINQYIAYLCTVLDESKVSLIVGKAHVACSSLPKLIDSELNYPTITVLLSKGITTISRTVTNVGKANVTYKVMVDVPKHIIVSVHPGKLHFRKKHQKKSFNVTISAKHEAEGNIMWISNHGTVVRSALVITR